MNRFIILNESSDSNSYFKHDSEIKYHTFGNILSSNNKKIIRLKLQMFIQDPELYSTHIYKHTIQLYYEHTHISHIIWIDEIIHFLEIAAFYNHIHAKFDLACFYTLREDKYYNAIELFTDCLDYKFIPTLRELAYFYDTLRKKNNIYLCNIIYNLLIKYNTRFIKNI